MSVNRDVKFRSYIIYNFALVGTIIIWVASIVLTRTNFYQLLNFFPHLSINILLNPIFWLALIFGSISFLLLIGRQSASLFCIILISIMVYFTPTLIQENATVYDSFSHIGMASAIAQAGHADPTKYSYHNWPTAFILGSTIGLILGMQWETIIYYFPAFFLIVLILGIFILARVLSQFSRRDTVPNVFVAAVMLAFFAENNTLQSHFCPQAFGFMMFIYFIYTLFKYESIFTVRAYALLCIILFFAITTAHPPSALFAVFVLLALGLLRASGRWRFKSFFNKNLKLAFIMVFLVILVSWQIFGVWNFGTFGGGFLKNLKMFLFKGFEETTYFVVGMPKETLLSYLSILKHIFFFCLGFIGFYIMLRKRSKPFPIVFSCALATLIFFGFSIIFVRGILWERVLLYGALPIALGGAYFIQRVKRNTAWILLIIISIFLLVNTFILYDSALQTIVPSSELATSDFVIAKIDGKSITMYINAPILAKNPVYRAERIVAVPLEEFVPRLFINPSADVQSIVLSRQMQILMGSQFYKLALIMNEKMNKVYSSEFNSVYLR